jgi:small subunit ribosomal protein S16
MSVRIRLARGGTKKRPFYRIVAISSRAARDGGFLEKLGTYNPILPGDSPERIVLREDRIRYWLGVGAKPSDRVARFLDNAGITESATRWRGTGKKAKEIAAEKAAAQGEAAAAAPAANSEPMESPAAETAPPETTVEAGRASEPAPAQSESAAEPEAKSEGASEEAPAETETVAKPADNDAPEAEPEPQTKAPSTDAPAEAETTDAEAPEQDQPAKSAADAG